MAIGLGGCRAHDGVDHRRSLGVATVPHVWRHRLREVSRHGTNWKGSHRSVDFREWSALSIVRVILVVLVAVVVRRRSPRLLLGRTKGLKDGRGDSALSRVIR